MSFGRGYFDAAKNGVSCWVEVPWQPLHKPRRHGGYWNLCTNPGIEVVILPVTGVKIPLGKPAHGRNRPCRFRRNALSPRPGPIHRRKTTRRHHFLQTMNQVMLWQKLCRVMEPFYPKGERAPSNARCRLPCEAQDPEAAVFPSAGFPKGASSERAALSTGEKRARVRSVGYRICCFHLAYCAGGNCTPADTRPLGKCSIGRGTPCLLP